MDEEEKRFIEWLRKQPNTRQFVARNSRGCPLDWFYLERGTDFARITDTGWMRRFVFWFDKPYIPYQREPMIRNLEDVEDWIELEFHLTQH